MATVTDTEEVIEYDDYIDQQIAKTSFHVKTVDLVVGLILLGLVVLSALFIFVLIDHWIVGLSFGARIAALVTVIGASLLVLATQVLPPLIRSINPEYSAQAVEKSFPSLKNGLVNFLFFRDRKEQIRESVYDGMRAQAATGLAEVPIDSAVDRSPIIKLGYALIAITAVWVAYIFLSPKDPLQTLQRIALPFSSIQRPAQVDITDVTPGNVEVFRGQTVEVRAKVAGLKEDALPAIEFSTLDGQLSNQQIIMREDGVAGYFVGVLASSENGIQQDLEYRIVAGDAISHPYEVHAVEAPHIVVDHIEYDFPSYTRQTDETVQGEGDIRAIEGTRVTIHGKANQKILRGHIELLPAIDELASTAEQPKSKQASMTLDGENGHVRLTVRLDSKRKQSIYRGYKLHFTNENNLASVDAIEHSIEAIPDLRPIVQILTPKKRTIEIPENGWQKIEVRAVDPDFQLTQVQLAARTRNRAILKENLLLAETATTGHAGQFVASYRFVPSEHELKAGDVVEYLAVAKDNRHSSLQNKLEPNRTISSKQYIRIVAADPMAEPPPEEGAPPTEKTDAADQPPENNPAERQPQNPGEKSEQGGDKNQKTNDQQDQTNDGQNQNQEQQNQEQQGGGEQNQPGDQQEQQDGANGNNGGIQQKGSSGGDSETQDVESGAPGESQNDPSDSQPGSNGGDRNSDAQNQNGGSQDNSNDDPGNSQNPNQESNPNNADSNSKNGGGDSSNNQNEQNGGAPQNEPLPSTGERDGEVVERIRRHMEENGELDDSESAQPENGESSNNPQGEGSDSENQGSSESAKPDSNSDPNKSAEQPGGSSESKQPGQQPNQQPNEGQSADRSDEAQPGDPNQRPDQQPGGEAQPNPQPGGEQPEPNNAPSDQGAVPKDDSPNHGPGHTGEKGDKGPGGTPKPSPNEGSPGQQGDRHTDAANSADQPGESPPDGKQPSGEQPKQGNQPNDPNRKPGPKPDNSKSQDGGSNSDRNADTSQESHNASDAKTGENGKQPGENQKPSEGKPTEQPNDTSGDTSADNPSESGDGQTGKSESGSKPGDKGKPNKKPSVDKANQDPNSQSNEGTSNPDAKGGQQGKSGDQSKSSDSQTGSPSGSPSNQGQGTHDGNGTAEGELTGDDANLDYARKATDLVLEYLKDKKNKPDQELLDKLGWKPKDVDKFVRRWDEMKKNAGDEATQPGNGKRALDDVLRGMGLRDPNGKLRRASDQNDKQRNNRNTGRRTKVPAELLDPFRAFQRALQNK